MGNVVRRFHIKGDLPLAIVLLNDEGGAVYYLKRWLAPHIFRRVAGSPSSSPSLSPGRDNGEGQSSSD
jgi:hypothetical protein